MTHLILAATDGGSPIEWAVVILLVIVTVIAVVFMGRSISDRRALLEAEERAKRAEEERDLANKNDADLAGAGIDAGVSDGTIDASTRIVDGDPEPPTS